MNPRARLTGVTILGLLVLLAFYWLTYAYAPEFNQRFLRSEDRLIEWLTFAGFVSASWVLARTAVGRPRLAAAYLAGLALFFFACAGEEISWGQRIIGFSTPDEIRQVNEQHEFNFHNLKQDYISPLGLVSMFMMVFGIAAPLIAWNRWPGFIPPVAVAPAFIFAELLSVAQKVTKPWVLKFYGADMATVVWRDTAEFKELAWGVACLLAALALRAAWRKT